MIEKISGIWKNSGRCPTVEYMLLFFYESLIFYCHRVFGNWSRRLCLASLFISKDFTVMSPCSPSKSRSELFLTGISSYYDKLNLFNWFIKWAAFSRMKQKAPLFFSLVLWISYIFPAPGIKSQPGPKILLSH